MIFEMVDKIDRDVLNDFIILLKIARKNIS